MATKKTIESLLLSPNDTDVPENYIGAAVLFNGEEAKHAGILIRQNGSYRLFHLWGPAVLQDLKDFKTLTICFQKDIFFVEPVIINSFVVHCEQVVKNFGLNNKYGFFFSEDSQYGDFGKFSSKGDMPEYMTCVGFCLNFLRRYLFEDFFLYSDWNNASEVPNLKEFIDQIKKEYPKLDEKVFISKIKRIAPIEYLAGAFSKKIPVTKSFTDKTVPSLKSVISRRLTA